MFKNLYPFCLLVLISCTNKNSTAQNTVTGTAKVVQKKTNKSAPSGVVFGKYGCTASSYNNGDVEYTPKGSFTLSANGDYTYYGFEKPSTGTFTVDKDGNLFFKGGYFDGGKAEKINRPNKFFLVFPNNPDHRWTCGLVEDK